MDPTQFAIQAVRHDERQKVAARLREIGGLKVANVLAQRDFIARHDLSFPFDLSDVILAVAAEVESWPIPEN
ncbi:hypothetical protein AB0F88_39950 [Streptosporangium sp. NPDC023963]|uniref:hypothetical protein n=1 Tax=Streptosporangium sp. NPDC023963 TaxID=3155608 RepID=UPI0034199F10